jgi:hypothetical protein
VTGTVEAAVRRMTKAEKVAYLRECGWYRASASGSQTWYAPGWRRINRHEVEPPEHDRCFYSLAAAIRAQMTKDHEGDDLTPLVREGRLTEADARAIRAARPRIEAQKARAAQREAEREAELRAWQERQEEERRMAPAWAQFVLAHSPGLADSVMKGTYTLREGVQTIESWGRCKFGCPARPHTPDEREQFVIMLARVAEGIALTPEEEQLAQWERAQHQPISNGGGS